MIDKLEDRSVRAHLWGIPKGFKMSLFLSNGSQYDCKQSYYFLWKQWEDELKEKSLKNNE